MKKESTLGGSVGNPFRALKYNNFRYYWIGMFISTIGTWMQNTAQPWLAYELTSSAFLLGLISALQFTPVLFFSLFAGVLIDKFKKKNILYITQAASFAITLTIAILDSTGRIEYWHLIVTSTLMGFVNTVDMPTRQSFVIELVGKEDLSNGIALNSAQFNLARILGPAIAGIVMGAWGTASCFLINSISYAAVIIGLLFIKPLPMQKTPMNHANIFASISDGLKFIFSREILYMPLLFLIVGATFAMNFNVLIPVFSIEVLGQKETGFGLLMSMGGLGALTGAITMAAVSKGAPKKLFLYVFPFVAAVFVVVIGLTNVYLLTGIALAFASYFYMIFMASVNTTMQLNAMNEYRGRVMSVYSLVVAGSTPLGNLFAGAIANKFGSQISFLACGGAIIILLLPLYWLLRKRTKLNKQLIQDTGVVIGTVEKSDQAACERDVENEKIED